MDEDDSYIRALRLDREIATKYYQDPLAEKPEQVKFLEQLLEKEAINPASIADICCGSGALALTLSRLYPEAAFTLVDLNPDAIVLARDNVKRLNATCSISSIYQLSLPPDSHDLVLCWQSLLDLDDPRQALLALVRICRPQGRIVVGSLFNFDFDVDIYARVVDHTRASSRAGIPLAYNTISIYSIQDWLRDHVSRIDAHRFEIEIDLPKKGRGLGTFTVPREDKSRMQVSAGMLMNWGVLVIEK